MVETNGTLAAVGVIVTTAFAASLLFRRYHVPDILMLLATGVLLGPLLGVVDVEGVRRLLPFVGTLAVLIVLFDGGLEIKPSEFLAGLGSGGTMALVVLFATSTLCWPAAYFLGGLSATNAFLLALIFGGAGVVIVLPLIQHMGVGARAVTVVTVEAVASDVLVIVAVYGLAEAFALDRADPAGLAWALLRSFGLGALLGAFVGWAWSNVLALFGKETNAYVVTLAVLCLVFASAEVLGGAGPVAALLFGFVVGNSKVSARLASAAGLRTARPKPVFGVNLVNFHHEIVFFIRAFFFVALGVTLDLALFAQPRFLLTGLALSLGVVAARASAVVAVFRNGRTMPAWDKLGVALMFPIGLIAAALSVVPSQRYGLAGTERFPDYAVVVIVATNVLATVLVFVASLAPVRARIERRSDQPRGS